jgi:Ca-activated chloride channel family protein
MRSMYVSWIAGSSVAVAVMLVASPLAAQSTRAQVREGNRLYEEGLFEEAHQKYLEALAAEPESGLVRFNDGNALYQGADYRRAMVASQAWYNLGNALYRQQQLQESLEAYKQALRLDPRDPDAKHNLERVLQQMQQQQPQDQQQDQDQQNQDQQNQDQQNQDQQQPGSEQPQEGPQQQQQQEPEGQDQQQDQQDQGQPPPSDAGQEQQGEPQPQPQPGEMTQEEAERLLDAIEEDPDEVDRRRAATPGRRPRKPW